MRAPFASPSRVGMSRYVVGSGIATMSDSSIALNPVIEDPSKPMPSSSASSSSAGVIAKLFRWPSMSVNQKRMYSTPSFSICFMTSLRAPGSEVARSLLSIIAIPSRSFPRKRKRPQAAPAFAGRPETSSSQSRPSLSAFEERPRKMDPLEFPLVAELFVDPAHRGVREVVLGPETVPAGLLRGGDLRLLQGERDAAVPGRAPDPRHRVLRLALGVPRDDAVAHHPAVLERDERELADRQRPEVAIPPLLERAADELLAGRNVGVRLERDLVGAAVVLLRRSHETDALRRLDPDVDIGERERHVLHAPDLLEAAPLVVRQRVRVVVANDDVEAGLPEAAGVIGGVAVQRGADPLSPPLPEHTDRQVREIAARRAAELVGRRDADRRTVDLGDQVEIAGAAPLGKHGVQRHRRLRVDPVADVAVRVDVRLREYRPHLDQGSGPWKVMTFSRST